MNSVYIHIPFCKNICSYCDFCKVYYKEDLCDEYLVSLKKEVISSYKGENISTIYIGGGTPSDLTLEQLKKLFDIIDIFKKDKDVEFSIESNINISKEKIDYLIKRGINRISLGIQTVDQTLLNLLDRKHTKEEVKKKIGYIKTKIKNINVDLIYAIPSQTLQQLENDLTFILDLNIEHVSAYSLLIEPHTRLYIDNVKNIDEDLDYQMYKLINSKLVKNGFINYEISNYAKEGFFSKHNLVYWNNLHYYGFGVGASGYIKDVRYDNTKSIRSYIEGKRRVTEEKLKLNDKIIYELILGFRKIQGININDFKVKYNLDLIKICSDKIQNGRLNNDGDFIKVNPDYLYTQNNILSDFIGEVYEGTNF